MPDVVLDLDPAAQEVARLARAVREDQMTAPTPCGVPVAALLDHLLTLTWAFTAGARKDPVVGGAPPQASAAHLPASWREDLPQRLAELVGAWREPAAWAGQAQVGGVRMPAQQMAVVALDELVLHGWDLARATGQPFACDPASTSAVLAFTAATARPEAAAAREGLFGPVVAVPDDAPALERALGLAGRDPAWAPGP